VVELVLLSTGVPGLDEVLGGGIPEHSFTIVAGHPAAGKTTLAQQIVFANASEDEPAAYFTGAGESVYKLCRHLASLTFFKPERLERDVHFVDIAPHGTERDAGRALDLVQHALQSRLPGLVVVDIPPSLTPESMFVELGRLLASSCATTVLITNGEPPDALLSLADTVLRMEARTVEAIKSRGREAMPGRHAVSIGEKGVRVFPRWPTPRPRAKRSCERLSTGVDALDSLMAGGILAGDSVLVEGPSGSGKTVLATQFIAESAHMGLPSLVVLSEERPERWLARGEHLDLEVHRLHQTGLLEFVSARGRDIAPDELAYVVHRTALGMNARSVLIDSSLGLQLVTQTMDPRDWLWRLLDRLSADGVTAWVNHSPAGDQLGALFDNVIRLRRVEHNGQMQTRLELAKASLRPTGPALMPYTIGPRGLHIIPQEDYRPTNGHLVSYRIAG